MATKISREVLEGYLNCRLKGYLAFRGESGTGSEYQQLLEQSRQELRRAAEGLVKARCPVAHDAGGTAIGRQLLMRGPALILNAGIENDFLSMRVDALKKVPGPSDLGDFHYIPMLFGEGGKARQSQKRALEICSLVLGEIQGRRGVFARVVFGDFSGGGLLLDAVDEDRPLDDLGQ